MVSGPRDGGDGWGPAGVPATLYWGVQIQSVDLRRLDPYLESVADQEQALQDSDSFAGRLVLRSQPRPDRFWVIDAWTDRYALQSAAIMLRTLSSVAGLVDPPREILTEQVVVGARRELVAPRAVLRTSEDGLPFFLIVENRVKAVVVSQYQEMQDQFAAELEEEPGYGSRMLLRDVGDDAHFLVIDSWRSERAAFEAFERRQGTVSEITMTRFLALLSERGDRDFALGIHG